MMTWLKEGRRWRSCPKCGNAEVNTIYHGNFHGCAGYSSQLKRPSEPECCDEHLHRICQRCHFEWAERTLKEGGASE